jgi:hypothetical protein
MEDIRKINAAEYLFIRLKKNTNTKAIKLKKVAPTDISINVIDGIKLLEEHNLISFNEGKRLIDKNIELWDGACAHETFSDFLKGLNSVNKVVDKVVNSEKKEKVEKPKKEKVVAEKVNEDEKVEE